MTIYLNNSTIFQPQSNDIRFGKEGFKVVSGANELSNMDLCGIKIPYKQYQKLKLVLQPSSGNYLLNFAMMGLQITFLAIKPVYSGSCTDCNFLTWNFEGSNDPFHTLTQILVLTGTTNNPIPPILLNNASEQCSVEVDILVSALDNDYFTDVPAYIYLTNLLFTSVATYGNTNSGILEFYNSAGIAAGTLNVSDIIDVRRVPNMQRIIIYSSASSNIVLDFATLYDTLQALSAINWLLEDPSARALPTSPDITGPVITLTTNVIGGNLPIALATYSNNFTIPDLITQSILSIFDVKDGNITPSVEMFKITSAGSVYNTITMPGTYLITVTATDIAGNPTVVTFNVIAS